MDEHHPPATIHAVSCVGCVMRVGGGSVGVLLSTIRLGMVFRSYTQAGVSAIGVAEELALNNAFGRFYHGGPPCFVAKIDHQHWRGGGLNK